MALVLVTGQPYKKRGPNRKVVDDGNGGRVECIKCRRLLPISPEFFRRSRAKRFGLSETCKECGDEYARAHNRKESTKRRLRAYRLQRAFGISLFEYEEMLRSQGGNCAICKSPTPGRYKHFQIDHSHGAGGVRGLLCMSCNFRLGWYERCRTEISAYLDREVN